uniref:Uncharacterized protein n=1 Tax=Amblyomma triste TaxID=251400 RepID=A0A023G1V5_AMBTT
MSFFAKAIYPALLFGMAFGTNHPSLDDLRKALGTSDKIWDVMRTEDTHWFHGKITCVFDKRVNQEGDKYEFQHGYRDGQKEQHMKLFAEVKSEDNDVYLSIKKRQALFFLIRYKMNTNIL